MFPFIKTGKKCKRRNLYGASQCTSDKKALGKIPIEEKIGSIASTPIHQLHQWLQSNRRRLGKST